MADNEMFERGQESGGQGRGRGPRGDGDRAGDGRPGDRGGMRRRTGMRRKVCRFCAEKTLKVDYKDVRTLQTFVTEGGKIVPSRVTGNWLPSLKVPEALALLPLMTCSFCSSFPVEPSTSGRRAIFQ